MLSTFLVSLPFISSPLLAFTLSTKLAGIGVFVVILCAMVVIHEFGHFIVAKVLGIPAEVFSVGFGKRLCGVNVGGTDFRLSLIPLGGYVRFRGENDLEMIQGKGDGGVQEFLSHPKWKRLLVAFAGPAFNIATAILIPTVAIMIGFQESAQRTQPIEIGAVRPGYPAEQAGLKPHDRIVAANGIQNPVWEDFQLDINLRPGENIPMTVERDGKRINLTVQPRAEGEQKTGLIGIEPYLPAVQVGRVLPNSAAARAGLQPGDKITAINGQPLMTTSNLIKTIKENQGKELTLGVERAGQPLSLKLTPTPTNEDRLGLGVEQNDTVFTRKTNIGDALAFGLNYNWRILKMNGVVFKQIFAGRRSARDSVAGPIGMAQMTTSMFEIGGLEGIVRWMGILSLSLGVMNLLPIPVLDGGMIVMILLEALLGLFGLALTVNIRERFQQVGFVALMLLMGFVIFNDVARLFTRSAPEPPAKQQPAPQPK